MKYWIVVHYYSSYEEHNDLIGLPAKLDKDGKPIKRSDGSIKPYYNYFDEIKTGDRFAYYCPAPNKFILGLYEIVDGPKEYTNDWDTSIQYKIKPVLPIKKENFISYYTLVDELQFFKDENGNKLEKRAAAYKLKGTIKEISQIDFKKLVKLYSQEEIYEEDTKGVVEISEHISMIGKSHYHAEQFLCESYIGRQERNRVLEQILSKNEDISDSMDQLPPWLANISVAIGTNQRISYIDNIWFIEESKGFFIPFAIIEHEKDGNIRGVMDRFTAMDITLKNNKRFSNIKPLYIIIARDKSQVESYNNKINEHGEWLQFYKEHKFHIYSIDDFEKLDKQILRILSSQIKEVGEY